MAWCLTKDAEKNLLEALQKDADPQKMVDRGTEGRLAFFEKYVGKENAPHLNNLFETKMLLKNQQKGLQSFIKSMGGSKQIRTDFLSKVERLDKALSKSEVDQFLGSLTSQRLGVGVTEEEAKAITEMSAKISDLKSKANKDGVFPTQNDRFAYGIEKVNLESYVNDLKLKAKSVSFKEQPLRKITKAITATPGLMKSLAFSVDNSFWGRQGIKTLADARTSKIWLKNFLKSWGDISKELRGKDAMLAIKADIYSRPNAVNGKYDAGNYGLSVANEEPFPSQLPEKIPLFKRLFKASESAYNGASLRLRADLADRFIKIAEKQGINTLNKADAMPMGNLVSSITGRGKLPASEGIQKVANEVFASVKFIKSNIDALIAVPRYAKNKLTGNFKSKGEEFAQKEGAKNSLSMLATFVSVFTILGFLNPDIVDKDPRSTNFGKVKIFGHWVDITGGMASYLTLMARITPTYHNGVLGFWSKTSTGNWQNLSSGEYGSQTALDIIENFFEGKLAPFTGIFRDIYNTQNYQGQSTFKNGQLYLDNLLPNTLIPLSIQNFNQIKNDPSSSSVLGSTILDGLGLSTSTYKPKSDWNQSTSKELQQFKDKVGAEKFQKANDDYNRSYNDWFNAVTKDEKYKKLSDQEKSDLQTQAKSLIKEKIFKEYGFKYKPEVKTIDQKQQEKENKKLLPNKTSMKQGDSFLAKIGALFNPPEVQASDKVPSVPKKINTKPFQGDSTLEVPQPPDNIRKLLSQYFSGDEARALITAYTENRSFDPKVTNTNTNGTVDYGIFQINENTFKELKDWAPDFFKARHIRTVNDLLDPEKNVQVAYALYQREDFNRRNGIDNPAWSDWYGWQNNNFNFKNK